MGLKFFRRSASRIPTEPTFRYVYSDRFPSRDAGLAFTATIRADWRRLVAGRGKLSSPRVVARALRPLVEDVCGQASVLRVHAAEEDVEAALWSVVPVATDGVEVLDARVRLSVDQDTIDAAMRLERMHHELELDDLARRQAKGRADFLREEILKNPASAQMYALFELSPRVGGVSPDVDFGRLVQQINDWHPESRWIGVAQILHDFLNGLSGSGRKDLLNIVQHALSLLGTPDQVARLSHVCGRPDSAQPNPQSSALRKDD